MTNRAEKSLPSRNLHSCVQLWCLFSQSSLAFTHHIFFSFQLFSKGPVSKYNALVFLVATLFLLYLNDLLCIRVLEYWLAGGKHCLYSISSKKKTGVTEPFLSYPFASRYCLFFSKLRIIAKPQDKHATFEHPNVEKYKVSFDNSLHKSIFYIPIISFIGALKIWVNIQKYFLFKQVCQ